MRKTLYLYSLLAGILSLSCSYRAYASVAVSYGGETSSITSYTGTNADSTQWDYVYNVSWGTSPEKPSQWGISSKGGTAFGATDLAGGGVWSGQYYSTVAAYNAAVGLNTSANIQALFGNGYGAVVWLLTTTGDAGAGSVNGGFHYTSTGAPIAVNTMSGTPVNGSGVTVPTWVSNSEVPHATTGTIYTSTPEPSSFWMLTLALSGFGLRKFRRRKRHEPRT